MKDLIRQETSLKEKIATLLNKQIKIEAESSAAYLAMAAWCDAHGFDKSGEFFYQQSAEEREHMLKIFKYLSDMGAQPVSPEVPMTNHDFSSLREVFETMLEAELTVTDAINNIVAECRKENDFATEEFMRWFVKEQVEEVFVARRALELLDMLSNNENGLLLFDDKVGDISYSEG